MITVIERGHEKKIKMTEVKKMTNKSFKENMSLDEVLAILDAEEVNYTVEVDHVKVNYTAEEGRNKYRGVLGDWYFDEEGLYDWYVDDDEYEEDSESLEEVELYHWYHR